MDNAIFCRFNRNNRPFLRSCKKLTRATLPFYTAVVKILLNHKGIRAKV